MTRVGLVQLAVEESEPVQERVARTLAAVTTAAAHADLVMLPELWPTGAFDLALGVEHAQSIDGPLVTELADVVVVDTPLGRTALATCYDLRFPELFRAQIDLGATAVLLTSGWPSQRIARCNLLAAARACENQMWVIGCNEVGRHGGQDLGGNSLIADPWGEVIAAAGQNEDTLYADIVPSLPAEVRASFPVLPDRRL